MRESIYKNPDLLKKIYDLRSTGDSFNKIRATVNSEFNLKISNPTIKNLYNRYIAKQLTISDPVRGKANEVVEDFQKKMDGRFEKISRTTDEMMDLLLKLKATMQPEQYAKYVPLVLAVSREILTQLQFIKKEQQQIFLQQKNIIYSPLQIMQVLNKEIVKLEKDGKIQINRTDRDGRIMTEEESLRKVKIEEKDD